MEAFKAYITSGPFALAEEGEGVEELCELPATISAAEFYDVHKRLLRKSNSHKIAFSHYSSAAFFLLQALRRAPDSSTSLEEEVVSHAYYYFLSEELGKRELFREEICAIGKYALSWPVAGSAFPKSLSEAEAD